MQKKHKIAILISGSGTNMDAIISAAQKSTINVEVVLVLSNKETAPGLTKAKAKNINTVVISHKDYSDRESFDRAMDKAIIDSGATFICMAGFMRLLSEWFVEKWYGKLINIHPSLLPAFKGVNAQEQALKAGVKVAGCTVHFVTAEMDAGPIIVQKATNVLNDDNVDSLRDRILELEHQGYIEAIKIITEQKYTIIDNRVSW